MMALSILQQMFQSPASERQPPIIGVLPLVRCPASPAYSRPQIQNASLTGDPVLRITSLKKGERNASFKRLEEMFEWPYRDSLRCFFVCIRVRMSRGTGKKIKEKKRIPQSLSSSPTWSSSSPYKSRSIGILNESRIFAWHVVCQRCKAGWSVGL